MLRVEEGNINECEDCDGPIGIKRLLARPVTTLCIECKEEREEREAAEHRRHQNGGDHGDEDRDQRHRQRHARQFCDDSGRDRRAHRDAKDRAQGRCSLAQTIQGRLREGGDQAGQ